MGNSAKRAMTVYPTMRRILISDISLCVWERRDAVFRIGVFGTIKRAPGKQARQLRDGDAVKQIGRASCRERV